VAIIAGRYSTLPPTTKSSSRYWQTRSGDFRFTFTPIAPDEQSRASLNRKKSGCHRAHHASSFDRNPNDAPDTDYTGYDFWLTKLNQFNGNYINAEMVKAFLSSIEYRQRFGP